MRDSAAIRQEDTVSRERDRREERERQASRTYERRGSYNACLNCEMIRYKRDH